MSANRFVTVDTTSHDVELIFTALQHLQAPLVIPVKTLAETLNTTPIAVACDIVDLKKKYGLAICATLRGVKSAGFVPTLAAADIEAADAQWVLTALSIVSYPVFVNVQKLAVATSIKAEVISSEINDLNERYNIRILGSVQETAQATGASKLIATESFQQRHVVSNIHVEELPSINEEQEEEFIDTFREHNFQSAEAMSWSYTEAAESNGMALFHDDNGNGAINSGFELELVGYGAYMLDNANIFVMAIESVGVAYDDSSSDGETLIDEEFPNPPSSPVTEPEVCITNDDPSSPADSEMTLY